MHAELSIRHARLGAGALRDALETTLGQHDPKVLAESLAGHVLTSPGRHLAPYATRGPTYTLVCWPVSPTELHVFVEPTGTDIRAASESAWLMIAQALSHRPKPRLESMELFARPLGRVVLEGRKGFLAHLGESTTLSLVGLGIANLVLLVWGWNTFAETDPSELLVGTLPGLVTAALALGFVTWKSASGSIRWRIK